MFKHTPQFSPKSLIPLLLIGITAGLVVVALSSLAPAEQPALSDRDHLIFITLDEDFDVHIADGTLVTKLGDPLSEFDSIVKRYQLYNLTYKGTPGTNLFRSFYAIRVPPGTPVDDVDDVAQELRALPFVRAAYRASVHDHMRLVVP